TGHVSMTGPWGTLPRVPVDVLVELLAFDPVLPTVPRRVPFLLPGHETATRQLDVQDGLVRRYGRAAWST
ncbi:hypothetical protein AN219_26445, partial [Streptomyces nanshensis]